jgi:hypothetical protein
MLVVALAVAVDGAGVSATFAGAAELLVSEKLSEVAPVADAVTEYEPAVWFAVSVLEVARPSAPVVAVVLLVPESEKVPEAPEAGAVNVTVVPDTGLP